MEYYSTMKQKGILPLVTIWMDLEDFMLRERIQTETKYCKIEQKYQTYRNSVDWWLPGAGERGHR